MPLSVTAAQSVARGSEEPSQARGRGPIANGSVTSRPTQQGSPTVPPASPGPLVTVGSNAPYGAGTSGHGAVPFSGLSLAPRRGKDGTNTMTLFVRNTGNGSGSLAGASANNNSGLLTEKDPGPDYGIVDDTEDAGDEGGIDVGETVSNAVSTVVDTVSDGIPAIVRAAHRPVSVVAGVFIYFVLVLVYILFETRHILTVQLSVQSLRNDRLISMTSSLTEQQLAKVTALRSARDAANTSVLELVTLKAEAQTLDDRRMDLIKKVAQQMSYPGPIDDVQFLIEEHVAYEELVKSVAVEETGWLHDSESLKRAYGGRGRQLDEKGRPINELVGDFDQFLYALAVDKWEARRVVENATSGDATVGVSPRITDVHGSISFSEEADTRSRKVKETIVRLRNSRVFVVVFISVLAFIYFRFA